MFQGVEYKVDMTKLAGERIVDLKFKGEAVKETDTFKLGINNYRYGGLKNMGIISGTPYFESDPKSLRSFIAEYIKENTPIAPVVDNNWEVIGTDFSHPLRAYLIDEIKAGRLELPVSEDGRSYNAKAINAEDMILAGLIPNEVLKANGIEVVPMPAPVPTPAPEPAPAPVKEGVKYVVQPGDALYKIGWKFNMPWLKIAEYNKLANPNLIFPNQIIMIPSM